MLRFFIQSNYRERKMARILLKNIIADNKFDMIRNKERQKDVIRESTIKKGSVQPS